MNDPNLDAPSADGMDLGPITVMFDTSVLLYMIMDEVGLKHDADFVPQVRKFVQGKNQAVLKEVVSQVEREMKRREFKEMTRNESIGGSGVGSMTDRVAEILRKEYKRIDVVEWESHSVKIKNILDKLISNPDHDMSQNWLKMKKTWLLNKNIDINQLKTTEDKRETLRILRKEMLRGRDVKILAKAMKISETRKIHFVSNDGDHVFLGKSVRALTEERMLVYRPRNRGVFRII